MWSIALSVTVLPILLWSSSCTNDFLVPFGILLLLSHFSRVRLCVTPEMAAHQAPPSLGLSKQEHWSGLPFPSPMHESEKWKWSHSVMSDSSKPHGLQPTRLLHPWDFPGKSTGVGCHRLLRFWLQFHFIAPHYMWMSSSFHLCSSSLSRIAHNVEILTPASSAHLEPITSWWNGLPVGGTLTWLDNNSLAKQSSHTDALFNLLGLTQPVKR